MKNGVLSNFTRSHISSDTVRSGYEINYILNRLLGDLLFEWLKAFFAKCAGKLNFSILFGYQNSENYLFGETHVRVWTMCEPWEPWLPVSMRVNMQATQLLKANRFQLVKNVRLAVINIHRISCIKYGIFRSQPPSTIASRSSPNC